MGRAEDYHQDCRWDVMQPESGTEKIQNGEHRERHRDEEKHALKQRDVPPEHKIADPYGVVQKKKSHGEEKPRAPDAYRRSAYQKCHRQQISNAAGLLHNLYPTRDRRRGWGSPAGGKAA